MSQTWLLQSGVVLCSLNRQDDTNGSFGSAFRIGYLYRTVFKAGAFQATVVVTQSEPTTKTTAESVPDDSVDKANENLIKAQNNMSNLAEKAAGSLNNIPISGRYFDLNTLQVGESVNGTLNVNGFDLEPFLKNMFKQGRESVQPK